MVSKGDESLIKLTTDTGWPASTNQVSESPRKAVNEIVTRRRLDGMSIPQPNVRIENVREVSSYSWLDNSQPKIVIPGLPPRWTPPRAPPRLSQDSGSYFRDQNAARYPRHPMEPAIRSVLSAQASSGEGAKMTSEIHVFACGSTLGSLLRFVQQKSKAFCFRVEVVGKTAFFIRKEKSPTQLIEGPIWGYGHTFPEAYTTWDSEVRNSESHQKVIRYSFGGKDMMVRFEADGYLPEKAVGKPTSKIASSSSTPDDPASLTSVLSQLRTGQVSTPATITKASAGALSITTAGHAIPQSAIFDLKTRSIKKAFIDVVGEELPRLWINQIPNFVLAFHQSGTFTDVRVQDVRGRVRQWETTQRTELRAFSGLLDYICETAVRADGGRCEVSWQEGAVGLRIKSCAGEDWAVMPDQLKRSWLGEEDD